LKVSGALSQEDESYWFSLKTGLSIEVTRCTTKVGDGEYLLFVSFDNDIRVFVFLTRKNLVFFRYLRM